MKDSQMAKSQTMTTLAANHGTVDRIKGDDKIIRKATNSLPNMQNCAYRMLEITLDSYQWNWCFSSMFQHKYIDQLGNHVEKNQRDAQLILTIFRQPLHVSGVPRPIIRNYNRMYTTICTNYTQVILNYPLFRITSTNCCIHTVVAPDNGPRYARNV
jgi:hypothetical protein